MLKELQKKIKITKSFPSYVADENGYRAGFRLGAAAIGGTRPMGPHIGPPGGPRDTTYISPKTNAEDRSYLPPH